MTRYQDEPFDRDEVVWQLWLTSCEWALLYSLWFMDEVRAERLPTDFDSGMRERALHIHRHNGYHFEGLRFDEDDRFYKGRINPVCEANAMHLSKLRAGRSPDLKAALLVAAEMAEKHESLRGYAKDLRQLFEDLMHRRDVFIAQRPPEVAREYKEAVESLSEKETVN